MINSTNIDVGGGSVPNETPHTLARIPLRWMVRQCFLSNTGIRFHASALKKIGLDPHSLYPFVRPRPAPVSAFEPGHKRGVTDATMVEDGNNEDVHRTLTEEEADVRDALSPIYDQLALKSAWWGLEVIPLTQRYQRDDNTWLKKRV